MASILRTSLPILPARAVQLRLIMAILFSMMISGCQFYTKDTMHNKPFDPKDTQKTRASETVSNEDLYNGKFIGIALSGGGSRAANFSAAVLLELDSKLQVLDKTTAISSVSGSSLPAAYYGLYGRDKIRWNTDEIHKQMKKDFETRWFLRWFLPWNAALYWTSNFNRSDIMKEVLDSNLFHDSTFVNMGSGRPHILINATSLSRGEHFIFSEEKFKDRLNSRIDSYPVANAVMASSAFPGVFHDMTLHDFSGGQGAQGEPEYAHVIDGGPFDNLGVITLLDMVDKLQNGHKTPKCFLFIVDSYPYPIKPKHIHDADTRKFVDYFVDSNVAESSDALLAVRRGDLLDQVNVDVIVYEDGRTEIDAPFHNQPDKERIFLDNDREVYCDVWHISLQRLLSPDFKKYATQAGVSEEEIDNLASIVNSIPTRYKLTAKDKDKKDIPPDMLQEYLFTAAYYLVNYDRDKGGKPILGQVQEWLNN
ncbi:MAG TPA: patatin-like phospholipase family protein [Syntrophales bacterium]|nr:patatin-like phospholipase family protein [Syntrophales bacterium]